MKAIDPHTRLTELTALIAPGLVYGLVLARGGSKGLPGKNVRPLGGHPIVAWAVACGRKAQTLARVICSTDDEAIAAAARAAGAETPFHRPAEAASDSATDMDVFSHCIRWLAEHEGVLPEFFVQLRPTTPFRDAAWVDEAVQAMQADPSITCIRSLTPAPHTPYKMWTVGTDDVLAPALTLPGTPEAYNMPRQALPPVYWHTGQLDVIRTETLLAGSMTGGRIRALMVPPETAVDIDSLVDFQLAELVFETVMPKALIAALDGPGE